MVAVHTADQRRRITVDRRCRLMDARCPRTVEALTDVQHRPTVGDVQPRRLIAVEAELHRTAQDGQVVGSAVVADRRVAMAEAEVTLPAAVVARQVVVAVTPQVVAAEDITVAAVRTEAVTNSYFHAGNETPSFGAAFLLLVTRGIRRLPEFKSLIPVGRISGWPATGIKLVSGRGRYHASNFADARMRDRTIAILLFCVVGISVAGMPAPMPRQHPAKCHGGMQAPPAPKSSDHQCCSIGHNRALHREIVRLRHSPAFTPVAVTQSSVDRFVGLIPADFFVDSASPPGSSPLRV